MTEIRTTIVGNLTADPELRFTPSGVAVANFTIAVGHRKKDGDQWVDDGATFIRCAAWRDLAENIAGTLTKGQRVIALGALRTREYDRKDGGKGLSVDLTVDEIGVVIHKFKPRDQQASTGWGAPMTPPAADASAWGTQTEAPF